MKVAGEREILPLSSPPLELPAADFQSQRSNLDGAVGPEEGRLVALGG